MKLKGVIEYWELIKTVGLRGWWWGYDDYIQFLKQPLQLWMFIPCDKKGKPFEKPAPFISGHDDLTDYFEAKEEYQQACDRKIFTGFELYQDTYFNGYNCVIRSTDMVIINIENKTIEDIAPLQVDLVEKVCKQFKY